jgi:hypothetical protein
MRANKTKYYNRIAIYSVQRTYIAGYIYATVTHILTLKCVVMQVELNGSAPNTSSLCLNDCFTLGFNFTYCLSKLFVVLITITDYLCD